MSRFPTKCLQEIADNLVDCFFLPRAREPFPQLRNNANQKLSERRRIQDSSIISLIDPPYPRALPPIAKRGDIPLVRPSHKMSFVVIDIVVFSPPIRPV